MNTINRDHQTFATNWLVRELQTGPVWCEKAVQWLEYKNRVQREATRAAIKDLLKQGEIRVAETAKTHDYKYRLLSLPTQQTVPTLEEFRREYNQIRKALKNGASDTEQLRVRLKELGAIYKEHFKAQLAGTRKARTNAPEDSTGPVCTI